MPDVGLDIELIRDGGRFAALGPEWNELLHASAADGVFLTWEWLHTWWTHLGGRRRLRLLVVRDAGRLLGIAPFMLVRFDVRRLLPFPALRFLGTGVAGSDDLDLIVRRGAEGEVANRLGSYLAGGRTMLHLAPLRTAPSAAALLAARLLRRRWRRIDSTAGICPSIDLSGLSWNCYLAGRGREHRYALRRKLRRLHERFDVRFAAVGIETERREALAALVEMHRRRWLGRGGSDAFGKPAVRAFHDTATRLMLERGWLRLYCLRLDGDIAAVVYGFLYGGVFSFYQIGWSPRFSRWSVGMVALGLSIRGAIEEGARGYDFLHGDEEYKLHWAGMARPLPGLELYPPRLPGFLCQGTVTASRVTRSAARRVLGPALLMAGTVRRRRAGARG